MKKKYIAPESEMIKFTIDDVLLTEGEAELGTKSLPSQEYEP